MKVIRKSNKNKWYVTFHTEVLHRSPNKIYYYAECNNKTQAQNVATDVYSIEGVKYIRVANKINKRGRVEVPMELWNKDTQEFNNYEWLL